MSDHEGVGIDNWEDASLPGEPLFSFRGNDSISHEVVPRNLASQNNITPNCAPPRGQYSRNHHNKPSQRGPPEHYRREIQALEGLVHRSSGIQGRQAAEPPPLKKIDNEAYQSYLRQVEPTSHHEISVTWRMLKSNIRFENWSTPERTARAQLDDICRKTNAYVPMPDQDSNRFHIWGTKEQADTAIKAIGAWVDHVRKNGIRPSRDLWTKTKAFDGRIESRRDLQERHKEWKLAQRLTQDEIDFEYVLHYQWPQVPHLQEFIDRYDKKELEKIREQVVCKIEFDLGTVHYYRISAETEADVKAINTRLNNMMMEMIAQKGDSIRSSWFKLPQAEVYRDRVGMDLDRATGLSLPTLFGNLLPKDEMDDWPKLCKQNVAKGRSILRDSISTCLSSLHAPARHVRMRVTFAELGFKRFQQPEHGENSLHFNEFIAMIPQQLTIVNPTGLRTRSGNLAELVDILDKMPEFGPPETLYTLHFDFNSRNQSTLRFEIEYCVGIMTGELEIVASRWLEYAYNPDEYEMLELNMVDLEHLSCNYQIHISGTNIYELEDTKQGMGKELLFFQDKVSYTPPAAGIKAPPRRHAIYPPGYNHLRGVEEITTVRYPFKDTQGVFELRRKDVYDEAVAFQAAIPTGSAWRGQYYYPEWDSLMGEFANLQPGEQVTWPRSLESFFLEKCAGANGDDGNNFRALPKGFNTWLKEIEEIQQLLSRGIERLESSAVQGL